MEPLDLVQVAADHARFLLCGALAGQLGDSDGAYPRLDLMTAIVKSLTLDAFAARHIPQQVSAWRTQYTQWRAEGNITYPHTIIDGGLDVAAETLDDLLTGHHRGNVPHPAIDVPACWDQTARPSISSQLRGLGRLQGDGSRVCRCRGP